jgi:hypothetical protein
VGWAGWEKAGASGEGKDGGSLVLQWLVRFPCDVLVGVGRLPVDVEFQSPIRLAQNGEVKHVDLAVHLTFKGPFDVVVDGVEEGVEGGDMIAMDGRHGVDRLAEPEEDDAWRWRCRWDVWRIVEVAVSGEVVFLKTLTCMRLRGECW